MKCQISIVPRFCESYLSHDIFAIHDISRKATTTSVEFCLSNPQKRKHYFLGLLSTLFVALIVMSVVKKSALGAEQKVQLGEKEIIQHADHHQQVDALDKDLKAGEKTSHDNSPKTQAKDESNAQSTKVETPELNVKDKTNENTGDLNVEVVEVNDTEIETKINQVQANTEVQNAKPEKPKVHNVDHSGYQPTEMISPTYYLPGTENAPRGSAAGGGFDYPLTNHFQFRNPDSQTASTWGFFDFEDPDEKWRGKVRPMPDFESVPHRDVKGSDFPDGAWQKDDEYMRQFLNEARKLVNRTMEGIYAEYGVGAPDGDLSKLTEEQWIQRQMFAPLTVINDINDDVEWNSKGKGMWTTKSSLDGLARRCIHAIMTQDTFHLTLGGHSAAAGHGNGFNQSYIIQAGFVLEPVFAHLGVTMRSYNFAQGGLGT